MRRMIFLLLAILACAIGLRAAEADSLDFKLLAAETYSLDMFYSSELQRMYVQLDFDIPKSALSPDYRYGALLDADAVFQSIEVAGNYENHYRVKNLEPENFAPPQPQAAWLDEKAPARFFGLPLGDWQSLPQKVHFRFWYYTSVDPFTTDSRGVASTGLEPDRFWYPRNTGAASTVQLKLTTTPYMVLRIGENSVTRTDSQYSRVHETTFTENPAEPVALRLIRD